MGPRPRQRREAIDGRPDDPRLDPGRRLRHGPPVARRLAPPHGHPLRRGPRHGRDGPGDRARPLASGARAALPRPSAVAGPGRRPGDFHGPPLRPRPAAAVRGDRRAGPSPGARRLRPRAAEQRGGHPRVQPPRNGVPATPRRTAVALGLLDVGLRGRDLRAVPGRDQRHRDLWRRSLSPRRRQELRPGRRPGGRHPRPRLQLRGPAVVRLRPPLGMPAGPAREPPRRADPRRRTPRLTAVGPRVPRPATVASRTIGTMSLSDATRTFLGRPGLYAVIATIDADGSPRQAVIWYRVDGDEIVINSLVGRRWPANLL